MGRVVRRWWLNVVANLKAGSGSPGFQGFAAMWYLQLSSKLPPSTLPENSLNPPDNT